MLYKLTSRFLTLILAFTFILVGCSSQTPAQTPTATPPTKISFQLSWTYDYSSAGFYAAAKNGHYAEQNLDVSIESGGYVDGHYVDPVQAITSGKNDFSEADAQSLLQSVADSKSVVAIAAVQQRTPNAVISLTSSHIERPQDLIGKTVAANDGGAMQLFQAMLKSQGIEPSQVNIVPRTDFGVDPLINGQVDALIGWVTNEGVLVSEAGRQASFMLLSDYGIPGYNMLLVTSSQMVQDHPDVVEHFLRASFAGWQDVISSPQQGAEYTIDYNKDLKLDQQLTRLQASVPLIQPARSKLGMMDPGTWQQIQTVMLNAGVLSKQIDVSKAYTMQFLSKIYPQ